MYKCVFCCSANVGVRGLGVDVRVSVEGVGRGCEGECRFQILAASNNTISVDCACARVSACVRACACMHACTCFHLLHLWYSDVLCVSCPCCGSHV